MTIKFVSSIEEALEEVWGESVWASRTPTGRRLKVEARL